MERVIQQQIFNTAEEVGVRLMMLLCACEKQHSLESLIYLDYIILHSKDIGGPKSLHAEIPYRKGELLVKRSLIQKALNHYVVKGLIDKNFEPTGIRYSSNKLSQKYLDCFNSIYFKKLRKIASWISTNIDFETESKLKVLVENENNVAGVEFQGKLEV